MWDRQFRRIQKDVERYAERSAYGIEVDVTTLRDRMCGSLLRVRAVGCLSGAFSPLLMRSRGEGTSGLSCFPRAPTLTLGTRATPVRSAVSTPRRTLHATANSITHAIYT